MHVKDYAGVVDGLLQTKPALRDSDAMLYYRLMEMLGVDPKLLTAKDLLRMIHYGELPHWEAISTVKRKLQSEDPKLRGKVWSAVMGYDSQQNIPFEEGE